jgi:uncharacterized membrane protein
MALSEKQYRKAFVVSLAIKAITAVTQVILGFVLLFTTKVTEIIIFLTRNELIEDPTDFFAVRVNDILPLTAHTQFVGALYLLVHGFIKVFLIWGLLKNKLWAYPASLVFIGIIVFYQFISLVPHHPVVLIILTLFDIGVAFLIWHEYRYLQRKGRVQEAAL